MLPMNSVDIYRKPPMFWMLCMISAAKVFTVWRGDESPSEHIIYIVVQRTPPRHANGNVAFDLLKAFFFLECVRWCIIILYIFCFLVLRIPDFWQHTHPKSQFKY